MGMDVRVPLAQAFWMALPLTVAAISSLVAPILMGRRVFWLIAGIVALAAFLWSLLYETDWMDRITLPLLAGGIAWCFWALARNNNIYIPEDWQPWPALTAVGLLVFSWAITGALWLAFGQELAQRSLFQEQSLWEALGELLVWRVKTPMVQDEIVRPLVVQTGSRRYVQASSGRKVPQADLIMFVRLGEAIGIDFQSWAERGWKLEQWQDVVDVLADLKVLSPRSERSKTTLVADDWGDALGKVAEIL